MRNKGCIACAPYAVAAVWLRLPLQRTQFASTSPTANVVEAGSLAHAAGLTCLFSLNDLHTLGIFLVGFIADSAVGHDHINIGKIADLLHGVFIKLGMVAYDNFGFCRGNDGFSSTERRKNARSFFA